MQKVFAGKGPILFLKCSLAFIACAALAAYIFILPPMLRVASSFSSMPALFRYAAGAVWYATALPFFFALFQSLRLLQYIGAGQAFSSLSTAALALIRNCAVAVCVLLMAGMPVWYYLAQAEDAPGLVLIGGAFSFAPLVIAAFAAVLGRLLSEAVTVKSEHELTV